MIVRIEAWQCEQCSHKWLASGTPPKRCAKCKSTKWNAENKPRTFNELPLAQDEELKKLPKVPAVYFVLDDERVMYVGAANSLKDRWLSHHRQKQFRSFNKLQVAWLAVSDSKELIRLETQMIKAFQPELNNQLLPADIKRTPNKNTKQVTLSDDALAILNELQECYGFSSIQPILESAIRSAWRNYQIMKTLDPLPASNLQNLSQELEKTVGAWNNLKSHFDDIVELQTINKQVFPGDTSNTKKKGKK